MPVSSPEVSVVVPVFNAGAYLRPLLDSLRDQTERSLQIIAIDDGSTDDSLAVLKEAALRDPRLTVVSQSNKGFSATRNVGLDHALGRWVAFADSDDWLDPRALQTWREEGERRGLEVVLGNGFRFMAPASDAVVATPDLVVRQAPPEGEFSGAAWIKRSVADGEWRHFVWLQLIRRDVLERHRLRFVEGVMHEDVIWTMQLALLAQRMGHVAAPLYGYRMRTGSFTHNRSVDHLFERARSYLVVMQRFLLAAEGRRDDDPALRRALLRQAQREGKNLFDLMREGGLGAPMLRELALEFKRLGLLRVLFPGAANPRTFWRAIRFWSLLRRCRVA